MKISVAPKTHLFPQGFWTMKETRDTLWPSQRGKSLPGMQVKYSEPNLIDLENGKL